MGDKSPKSKQKNKHQKDSKSAADETEKKRVIESKKLPKPAESKKKK